MIYETFIYLRNDRITIPLILLVRDTVVHNSMWACVTINIIILYMCVLLIELIYSNYIFFYCSLILIIDI